MVGFFISDSKEKNMLSEKIVEKIRTTILEYVTEHRTLPWTSGVLRKNAELAFGKGLNGRPYSGINALMTYIDVIRNNFDCWEYLTLKEIAKRKGHLNEKSHGVPIVWWVFAYYVNGEKVTYKEYRQAKAEGQFCEERCLGLKAYYVFNLAQTDLPYTKVTVEVTEGNETKESAEEIVGNYLLNGGPEIEFVKHVIKADGYYIPSEDIVRTFPIGAYKSSEEYYCTLFHELTHSTGHPSRLNRPIANKKETPAYAKEELIAETGASLLMTECGFKDCKDMKSAAYIESWEKRINDKDFVRNFTVALGKAVKAANWILGDREAATKVA